MANAPSAPQISLPSRSGQNSPSCCDSSDPISTDFFLFLSICTSVTAVAELCSLRGEVPWNIVTDSHCALALSRALTRTESVLSVAFLHAREAFFGASKCKFCENLHLKTLCSRLEVYERESSVLPRRAPEASAAFCEYTTWDSDVELEAMEGEPMGLTLSLPL